MHDVLLVLPMIGQEYLYTTKLEDLSEVNQKWYRRLTRVPQGLLSIASLLTENGYKVKVFDSRLHVDRGNKGLVEDLTQAFLDTRLFAGISVLTMHIPHAIGMANLVKAVKPNLPFVWGGYHPTLFPEQTVTDPVVEYVVEGEGEYPMLMLAKAFESGIGIELVRSLWRKDKDGKIHHSQLAKAYDPNTVDEPHYETLEVERYLSKQSYNPDKTVRGLEYNGSRGCGMSCAFCINRVLPQNHHWRGRDSDKILSDLKMLKDRYKLEYIFFEEEYPFMNRARSFDLAENMGKLGLPWYANIRADLAVNEPELLTFMRENGWCETSLGAESGSDRMLKYIEKQITVADIEATARLLNKMNVYALYSFMIDLPTETLEEKMMTFSLMRRLKKIHQQSEFIGAQTYRPYPKTKWYTEQINNGLFAEPSSLREWVTSGLAEFYAR